MADAANRVPVVLMKSRLFIVSLVLQVQPHLSSQNCLVGWLSSIHRDLIPRGDGASERNPPVVTDFCSTDGGADRLSRSIDGLHVYRACAANTTKCNASLHGFNERRRLSPISHVRPG